jgi:hypothetical protein
MDNPTTLEYAPKAHRRSRARIILRILLLVLTLAFAGAIYYDRVDLWLRIRRLYWSHECMIHVTPPGTVLVEYDPVKAAKLLATNPDYVADGKQWSYAGNMKKMLQDRRLTTAVYWPTDWRNFISVVPLPSQMILSPNAIAFLGERTSPGGHRRLVVIPVSQVNNSSIIYELRTFSIVQQPPTLFGSVVRPSSKSYSFSGHFKPVDLSPGIADPADASHLSLDFVDRWQIDQARGTIDIYLRDDDTLNFQIRNGPATRGIVNVGPLNQN